MRIPARSSDQQTVYDQYTDCFMLISLLSALPLYPTVTATYGRLMAGADSGSPDKLTDLAFILD